MATESEMTSEADTSEEEDRAFKEAIQALIQASAEPEFEDDVSSIISLSVASQVTPTTFGDARQRLAELTGSEDVAALILGAVASEAGPVEGDLLELGLNSDEDLRIVRLIRRLRAHYQPSIAEAYGVWLEDPDDWKRVDAEVTQSFTDGRLRVRMTLDMNRGDSFTLRSPVASFSRLLSYMLDVMGAIPLDEDTIDPADLEAMVESAQRLAQAYQTGEGDPGGSPLLVDLVDEDMVEPVTLDS